LRTGLVAGGRHSHEPAWRPSVVDVVLVVGLVMLNVYVAVWSGLPEGGHSGAGRWAGLCLQVVVALAMVWRRRWPLVVLGVVVAAGVVMSASVWWIPEVLAGSDEGDVWVPLATPFAAYAAVVYAGRSGVAWGLIGVVSVVAMRPWGLSYEVAATGLVLTAVPGLLGMYAGARRNLIVALMERAESAERERFLLAEQARAEERVRLAGEMHDVVTHRVSLMVLQAGALRVSSADERVRAEAEALRAAGCQALEELRDLVGVLRSPASVEAGSVSAVNSPVGSGGGSGLGVGVLVEESRGVGVEVELVESGEGAVMSPVVARTGFRIVQEALTNVRKHAPGSGVRLEVRYEVDRVRLWVRNGPARVRRWREAGREVA
jgi:signal transduction histidine kinase